MLEESFTGTYKLIGRLSFNSASRRARWGRYLMLQCHFMVVSWFRSDN
jgi:hypothetical protein